MVKDIQLARRIRGEADIRLGRQIRGERGATQEEAFRHGYNNVQAAAEEEYNDEEEA